MSKTASLAKKYHHESSQPYQYSQESRYHWSGTQFGKEKGLWEGGYERWASENRERLWLRFVALGFCKNMDFESFCRREFRKIGGRSNPR